MRTAGRTGSWGEAPPSTVPAAWVTGDEIYGNDGSLLRWLEGEGRPYVLAVARSHSIGQDGMQVPAETLRTTILAGEWQRIAVGAGSKGPWVYDWAWDRLPYVTEAGWAQWLLIRRSVSHPEDLAFYRAFAREAATISDLA